RADSDPWRVTGVLDQVERVDLDLEDPASVAAAVKAARPDVVFHLAAWASGRSAATDPDAWTRSFRINTQGTMQLLQAVGDHAPGARFVRAGGMEEYGDGPVPFVETQRERAVSPYSASQIAATQMSHALGAARGIAVTTLRPALVYGPTQDPSFFLPGCVKAAAAGEDFEMTDGTQEVDFIFVGDVVRGFLAAAVSDAAAGEIINLGSGEAHPVRFIGELVYRLAVENGRGGGSLRLGARPHRAGEAPRRAMNIEKADRVLGWSPRVTLPVGVDRTLACE
ncbi:MAG: NAD-dependent epimerase/dehydratase family protein, partial [Gemmatimonadetes bacterium]|nr:NAD-dependent epimerase/dehydratase family protein [Gemmatimonadota bacterium]